MDQLIGTERITLDVTSGEARQLRQRLRARAEISTTAILPGGAIVEETPEALHYHFQAPGDWRLVEQGDAFRLEHAAGHVLTIRGGRIQLSLAK